MKFLLALMLALAAPAAQAEHEVDHRYQVRGYVLDANDRAVANQQVSVYADGELLDSGKTDASGYYSLHLHLHNEDNGRRLRLRAGPHQAELRVSFDPSDLATQRVHEANFVGGNFVEGGLGRLRLPPWVYPLLGLFLAGLALVWLEKRRRRKLLRRKLAASAHSAPGGKKPRKTRRRKR